MDIPDLFDLACAQLAAVLKAEGPIAFARQAKLVKDGVERDLNSFTEAELDELKPKYPWACEPPAPTAP